jgi:hydrogenase maturation protein HypF
VHGLASRLGLDGHVGNDSQGVVVEIEGPPTRVRAFVEALEKEPPPLALIERIDEQDLAPLGRSGFVIARSDAGGERQALVSPDTATCADCLRELWDPADRRHRYPFVNCTNCGPRFTIIRDVPYDRPTTTMAGFQMCAACRREYEDPLDRRFHAQPVCCPACGPALRLTDAAGAPLPGDPVAATVAQLRAGEVVAIKGLGGYHLAAAASREAAVAALRSRKHREDKPFAVMVPDLATAGRLCELADREARLLTSIRAPIVLLRRRAGAVVAPSVAPGNRFLGLMLPYTPLHHLLARDLGGPFVLTSGNVSDEPIAYRDEDALRRLGGIADAFLTHDRPIHVRTDDSVVRLFQGHELPVRRSRGHAPQPVPLPIRLPRPVLACGAELKCTFAVAKGRYAFVSHHIGDLENYETLRSFTEGIGHFQRLFDVRPEIVAHDLHPEYLSTKHALGLDGLEPVGVQHHHAHVASCLADNGETGPAIGVAFDGLGFGTDGTLWGGEFLVAELAWFDRAGSLRPVPMPGGVAAIREPWRMAACYLDLAFEGSPPRGLGVVRDNRDRWDGVLAVARAGVNAPATSSVGRLFDAAAAILRVRDRINYEGQAAVELEQLADTSERGGYPVAVEEGPPFRVQGIDLVRAVAEDLLAGTPPPVVAARFHNAIAWVVLACCQRVRGSTGLGTVALSGGVFQNLLLLGRVHELLRASGFRVLSHSRVPPNDGGISLGQVAVAGARAGAGGR